MTESTALSISEELLLLSLNDEKGKVTTCGSEVLSFTLAGAVLFELMALGKLKVEDEKVVVFPTEPLGDPIFDMAAVRFAKKKKVKKLTYWVQTLAKDSKKIKQHLLDKLIELGALKKEERTFLWVFNYNRFPEDDGRIEDRVRIRIRESLYGNRDMDTRDYILLTLIGAAKLEAEVFPDEQVEEARERISRLRADDEIGSAITSAIKEFEAAMAIAITTAVIIPAVINS